MNTYRRYTKVLAGLVMLTGSMFSVFLHAQTDTTLLSSYILRSSMPQRMQDFGSDVIDSLHLSLSGGSSLADLLAQVSPATMRYYGPGQLASAGFRGASASQTMVVWNGIRFNNPMMMQADLSLVPVSVIREGMITYGPGTLEYTSGAFGGAILINSLQDTQCQDGMVAEQVLGSFGYASFSAGMHAAGKRWSAHTLYYREVADNDYPFPDNYSSGKPYPVLKRLNASWYRQGAMQQLTGVARGSMQYKLLFWADRKFNHIPYPIHQSQGEYEQTQLDEAFRILASAERMYGQVKTSMFTGYQYGFMQYIESRSLTNALHATHNLQYGINARGRIYSFLWKADAGYELQQVITTAYLDMKRRHILSGYGEVMHDDTGRWLYGLIARIEYIPEHGPALMPSAMAGFRMGKNRMHVIKGMIIRNRQLPGFNDLYWVPGGNPDLLPEKGWGTELNYEMNLRHKTLFSFTPRMALYQQWVENKISWVPDSGALWVAANLGSVQMKGAEVMLKSGIHFTGCDVHTIVRYQYAQATRGSAGDNGAKTQLVYQPFHAFSVNLLAQTLAGSFAWETTWTGMRYTDSENTSWLPPYTVSNLKFHTVPLKCSFGQMQATFSLFNLFDQSYQVIAWYPMPKRNFRVGIMVRFNS